MDLRKEIMIGVVLVLIILILYSAIDFWKNNSEKTDIKAFIIEDLKTKHPDADVVEILSMEQRINDAMEKYYFIKAKVTVGLYGPCPVRIHYYYNYPEQNFVTLPPEYITTEECIVCKTSQCAIAFEEQAIIASHTLEGTEEVHHYITYTSGAYPEVEKIENEWIVSWNSPLATTGYRIVISPQGKVLEVEKTQE